MIYIACGASLGCFGWMRYAALLLIVSLLFSRLVSGARYRYTYRTVQSRTVRAGRRVGRRPAAGAVSRCPHRARRAGLRSERPAHATPRCTLSRSLTFQCSTSCEYVISIYYYVVQRILVSRYPHNPGARSRKTGTMPHILARPAGSLPLRRGRNTANPDLSTREATA